ncbi:MAG: hypothetical protein WBW48_10405 [Anaerolineae bacterium]
MNFPLTHPLWIWLYFGTFGTTGLILFTLLVWNGMKYHALVHGCQRLAARWSLLGYMFLFFAAWFACGIGGPPGNMLSSDPTAQNPLTAVGAAILSMFFSVLGWACVLVSQRKILRGALTEE